MKQEITFIQETLDAEFGQENRVKIMEIFARGLEMIDHPHDEKQNISELKRWIEHREQYYKSPLKNFRTMEDAFAWIETVLRESEILKNRINEFHDKIKR